ncbi:MAG: hypothetical protein EXR77_11420 [Myxococcales bacterium]|nr:hypothetical protein [Myxococcales bacterium]
MFSSRFCLALVAVLATALVTAIGCKKDEVKTPEPPKTTEEPADAEQPKPADPAAAASPADQPAAASPVAAPAAASPTGADAATVLQPGVKFMFSLADSPDALAFSVKRCDEDAKGDAAKATACMDEIKAQAPKEGIRLDKEGDQWIFVSFGNKTDGTEELFLRGPVAKLDSAANQFKFKGTGACTGAQAAAMGVDKFDQAKADAMVMALDVVDATTVAMQSPGPKGRLVYKKLQIAP